MHFSRAWPGRFSRIGKGTLAGAAPPQDSYPLVLVPKALSARRELCRQVPTGLPSGGFGCCASRTCLQGTHSCERDLRPFCLDALARRGEGRAGGGGGVQKLQEEQLLLSRPSREPL